MDESNRSDDAVAAPQEPTARRWTWAQDLCIAVGVLAVSSGAAIFHVGAGLIVFGLALVLVGVRATPSVT